MRQRRYYLFHAMMRDDAYLLLFHIIYMLIYWLFSGHISHAGQLRAFRHAPDDITR